MAIKINDEGISFIHRKETLRLKAYDDGTGKELTPDQIKNHTWSGYPSIGWGHLIRLPEDEWMLNGITEEQANEIENKDLKDVYLGLSYVKPVINQNQINAIADLIYNIGSGNFKSSTLLKKINMSLTIERDYFTVWNKTRVDGKLIIRRGLTIRRNEEYELYCKEV